MAENKTKPTKASVAAHLASITSADRRKDCKALAKMMARITKARATMWGPSMVGFGTCHYIYESGREGDMFLAGFAARQREIVVYVMPEFTGKADLLKKLGKHRSYHSCIYIRNLDDVDAKVLEKLVVGSMTEAKRLYG